MQKFTRALTREIEIGGERLAVTLDAGGVTIRPVGSRRPPHTLGWPAVVCASVGRPAAGPTPGPDEVAAALAALHKGAAKAPEAPPPKEPEASAKPPEASPKPAEPAAGLPALLARLDGWLARHRPRYYEGLEPGATPAEIEGLAQALGRPVPDELRQWLGWHNGQSEEVIGAFYEAFNLMSAAQVAAAWQERGTTAEPGWDKGWIPLLDDYQGDLIVLDPSQPGCAVREVWRGLSDHPVVASTLVAWVEAFLADVEAGRYHEDPERGEFHKAT
jgi:cell wall assembly regulator SMI1